MTWYPGGPLPDTIPLVGISVVAKDGVLVSAHSYADDGLAERTFFDILTPADEARLRADLTVYVEQLEADRIKQSPSANESVRSQQGTNELLLPTGLKK